MTLNGGMMSSERDDWRTPEIVLEAVREVAPIALDPCAHRQGIVNAATEIHFPKRDGLRGDWSQCTRYGLAYVNPPYGRSISDWTRKAVAEARKGTEIVMLVPARTDARWWQECCESGYVTAICFWRGRVTFLGAPSTAPFPSALFYFGLWPAAFRSAMSRRGLVVRP